LVGIEQLDRPNFLLASQSQNGIEEADEDIGFVLAAKDFLEGYIIFGIDKFHQMPPEMD
jgi:hypothetical protein